MLDFKNYELVGLNCPYFTGVADHGQKLTLDLDDEGRDRFEAYCEGQASIHVHQDGAMYVTVMDYNNRNEEWEETIILDLTGDESIRAELDAFLRENPLYRSNQFPYDVSTERDFWGCKKICDNYDSLIAYLKNYQGGKN